MRTLRLTDTGADVRELQHALLQGALPGDPPLLVSGTFDDATRQAVIRFQHRQHLREDGVAGSQTFAALFAFRLIRLTFTGSPPRVEPGLAFASPQVLRAVTTPVTTADTSPRRLQGQVQTGVGRMAMGGPGGQLALTLLWRSRRLGQSRLSDDPHVEHSGTAAFGTGSGVTTLQLAYQVVLADLALFGPAHLSGPFFSPYVTLPLDSVGGTSSVQIGVQTGAQLSVDLVPGRLSFGVQGVLAGFYDFSARSITLDAGFLIFVGGAVDFGPHVGQ